MADDEYQVIQQLEPEPGNLTKGDAPTVRDVRGISNTNISSIFWAIRELTANGRFIGVWGFPAPVICRQDSQISVSITELNSQGIPFVGNAAMQVLNVSPDDLGNIFVRCNVDWSSPLRLRFNFIIVN